MNFTERVELFGLQTNYWVQHATWLSFAWFGAAFIASLARKKLAPPFSIVLRVVLYAFVYAVAFGLFAITMYRVSSVLYRFDTWPFWRRFHILSEIILTLVLVAHLLTGVASIWSKEARSLFSRLQVPLGHFHRLMVVLCWFILNRYYIGLILLLVGIAEWYVLRSSTATPEKLRID